MGEETVITSTNARVNILARAVLNCVPCKCVSRSSPAILYVVVGDRLHSDLLSSIPGVSDVRPIDEVG